MIRLATSNQSHFAQPAKPFPVSSQYRASIEPVSSQYRASIEVDEEPVFCVGSDGVSVHELRVEGVT
jgi:hypothetical protein